MDRREDFKPVSGLADQPLRAADVEQMSRAAFRQMSGSSPARRHDVATEVSRAFSRPHETTWSKVTLISAATSSTLAAPRTRIAQGAHSLLVSTPSMTTAAT